MILPIVGFDPGNKTRGIRTRKDRVFLEVAHTHAWRPQHIIKSAQYYQPPGPLLDDAGLVLAARRSRSAAFAWAVRDT